MQIFVDELSDEARISQYTDIVDAVRYLVRSGKNGYPLI
jgi:hypothetical protein